MTIKATSMKPGGPQKMEIDARYLDQNARLAIQDVYDAIIELLTNADDRYEFLGKKGDIHIEVERRRGNDPSTIRIRDFADGMTLDMMQKKLCQLGKRVSGMAEGKNVRGTNSRGAKDVAILGGALFESIGEDGRYHKCKIDQRLQFIPFYPSLEVSADIRHQLGIPEGTGTVVTLTVDSSYRVPQHEVLKQKLPRLVALRDILTSQHRRVFLKDLNQDRKVQIKPLALEGHDRLKVRFEVPGYPQAEAKLIVRRAPKRFERESEKFRTGGILIKARHALHQATYLALELENDPHAAWFFGRLTCEYIDDVWNEYDDRREKDLPATAENPHPIFDPLRKAGLRRDHPFTQALFREALKHFRPLVEEERKQADNARVKIENAQTQKRLNSLEKAAIKFMEKHISEESATRDPNSKAPGSKLLQKGYALNPPFAQIVKDQGMRFWLNVKQDAFPELSTGDMVEVTCLTQEISSSKRYAPLEAHPIQEGVLRTIWTIKAEQPTPATGIKVQVSPIVAESTIEVLESERDKYVHVKHLCFNHKRYAAPVGKAKSIEILAPYPSIVSDRTSVSVECSNPAFKITGERFLLPLPELGVAICRLRIFAQEPDHHGELTAKLDGVSATAEVASKLPHGSPIKIELKDDDFQNQRSKWHGNVLQVATRHASVRRYLGPPPDFKGQDEIHFRVLLAEIVAEAVCQRVLGKAIDEKPEEFQDADWDLYYSEYSKLMTEFLPIAHVIQVKSL